MAYRDFKDLPEREASDKALINRLASMLYKF